MIDYFQLKEEVKRNLLRIWQSLDLNSDSLIYAWITFVMSTFSNGNNTFAAQALDQGRRWVELSEVWTNNSNLSSISLFSFLDYQSGGKFTDPLIPKFIEATRELISKGVSKFSKLNDPYYMFCLILGSKGQLPEDIVMELRNQCLSGIQSGGSIVRTLLFQAAAIELNATIPKIMIQVGDLQPNELFAALWFAERYRNHIVDDRIRQEIWNSYDRVKEGINLDPTDLDISLPYSASPFDLAMFFEALAYQTTGIDPVILFSNMPLHQNVKRVSESLFVKGEYVSSVFEATKAYIEAVKAKAGHPKDPKTRKELDGFKLMEFAFLGKPPLLKFNPLSTLSEKDEQSGLGLLSEGVVSAFRNPKGHTPATGISLSPYEALEQLSTVSYLFRRLDSSTK